MLIGEGGDGGVPHHDHVVAEGRHVAVLAGAEALAQAHENEQRTDSPGDSKHGQEAAQLVGQDGAKDLTEGV